MDRAVCLGPRWLTPFRQPVRASRGSAKEEANEAIHILARGGIDPRGCCSDVRASGGCQGTTLSNDNLKYVTAHAKTAADHRLMGAYCQQDAYVAEKKATFQLNTMTRTRNS